MSTKKSKSEKKTKAVQKEIDLLKNKYLRALADYQNLEKRTEEKIDVAKKYAAQEVLRSLLSVFDTFERAQAHLHDEGLALGLKDAHAFLEEQHVKRIQSMGCEFNPHLMDCVEAVEGKKNIVIEEVLPGYTLKGKVLRVAQVKVGIGKKIKEKKV